MFNRRYRNEYEVVINEKTGKKELRYIGDYYRFEAGPEKLAERLRMYILLLGLIVGLYIVGALIDSAGTRVMYVMVPYAVAIFPMVYLIMAVVRTGMEKGDMEHIAFDCSVTRIKKTTISNMVIMGISFVGDIIFIITKNDIIDITRELLFAFTMLAIFGINYYLRALHAKYTCLVIENPASREKGTRK